jgi:hypothetical protein
MTGNNRRVKLLASRVDLVISGEVQKQMFAGSRHRKMRAKAQKERLSGRHLKCYHKRRYEERSF